jgi:hypothetical protein
MDNIPLTNSAGRPMRYFVASFLASNHRNDKVSTNVYCIRADWPPMTVINEIAPILMKQRDPYIEWYLVHPTPWIEVSRSQYAEQCLVDGVTFDNVLVK